MRNAECDLVRQHEVVGLAVHLPPTHSEHFGWTFPTFFLCIGVFEVDALVSLHIQRKEFILIPILTGLFRHVQIHNT